MDADPRAVADPQRRGPQRLEADRPLGIVEGRLGVGDHRPVADHAAGPEIDPGLRHQDAAGAELGARADPHGAAVRLDPAALAEPGAVLEHHPRTARHAHPHAGFHTHTSAHREPAAGGDPQPCQADSVRANWGRNHRIPQITCASIAEVGEYTVGVTPTVLTMVAGAALGGGIALGVTVIIIAAVIALVVLGANNAARSLQQLFS